MDFTDYDDNPSILTRMRLIEEAAKSGTFEVYANGSNLRHHTQEQHVLTPQEVVNRFINDVYSESKDNGVVSTFVSTDSRRQAMKECVLDQSLAIAHWDSEKNSPTQSFIATLSNSPSDSLTAEHPAWSLRYDAKHGRIIPEYNTTAVLVLRQEAYPSKPGFDFGVVTFYTQPTQDSKPCEIDLAHYIRNSPLFQKEAYPLERTFLLMAADSNTPTANVAFSPLDDKLTVDMPNHQLSLSEEKTNLTITLTDKRTRAKRDLDVPGLIRIIDNNKMRYPNEMEYLTKLLQTYKWPNNTPPKQFAQAKPDEIMYGLLPNDAASNTQKQDQGTYNPL